MKYKLIAYFRHANILMIYDQRKTSIDKTLIKLNKQLPNIKFTIGK
jgi:hypothetical protein